MTHEHDSLEQQAKDFASQLTTTVQSAIRHSEPFGAKLVDGGERFVVEQRERHGIPLVVGGEQLFSLKVKYKCCLDGRGRFLAVEDSTIKVFAGAKASGDPLIRYEYERNPVGNIPAAHIHVHAHRDAFCGFDGQGRGRNETWS